MPIDWTRPVRLRADPRSVSVLDNDYDGHILLKVHDNPSFTIIRTKSNHSLNHHALVVEQAPTYSHSFYPLGISTPLHKRHAPPTLRLAAAQYPDAAHFIEVISLDGKPTGVRLHDRATISASR